MAVIDLLRQAVEDRPDKTAVIAEDGAATSASSTLPAAGSPSNCTPLG